MSLTIAGIVGAGTFARQMVAFPGSVLATIASSPALAQLLPEPVVTAAGDVAAQTPAVRKARPRALTSRFSARCAR